MVIASLSMPLDDGEYFTPDRSSAFVKMDTHPSETDGCEGGSGKGKYGMDASTRALRVVVCGYTLSGRSSFMARKVGGESGRVGLRKIISLTE